MAVEGKEERDERSGLAAPAEEPEEKKDALPRHRLDDLLDFY